MKLPLIYSGKLIYVKPYTTVQEKEILLYDELNDSTDLDGILDILGDYILCDLNIKEFSDYEKLAILYKIRSLSVGEEVSVKFSCEKCGRANESFINISEIIQPGDNNIKINDIFQPVDDYNINEFVDINIDELDISEYEELKNNISKASTKFDFIKKTKCAICGSTYEVDISDKDFCIKCLSDDTLTSLYQTTADLVFYGHYSKLDIDSMFPYERLLFVGLLNATRERLNT